MSAVIARNRELENYNHELENRELSVSAEKTRLKKKISDLLERNQDLERDAMGLALTARVEAAKSEKTSVDTLIRAVAAENNLHREKHRHAITHEALAQAIAQVQNANESIVSPSPLKRGRRLIEKAGSPAKKLKTVFVTCIECYQSKITKQCDGSTPCWPCKYQNKECKRMRCKNFQADTCHVLNCSLAHSDSGFPEDSLETKRHVTQILGPAPVVPANPNLVRK